MKNGEIEFRSRAFFDKKTHYFCEETNGYVKENLHFPIVTICRYFESFDEFISYRNEDLTHCDLSAALECKEDFSKYIVDETTKLPIHTDMEATSSVKEYYHDGKFYVVQQWSNKSGSVLKRYKHTFNYFSRGGSLTILNGGAMKKLEIYDIQYYYNNMEAMISTIKAPLDKFTSHQKHIANVVKRIGGNGTIHGSIIDIDFYNHIYVNPIDLSMTGYWASDMINKIVYSSIPALLEKNCPVIFGEYVKLLKGNDENPLEPKQQTNIALLPQIYLNTDIYKASREIKKMQKLSSNILSSWYEDTLHKRPQIELI